MSMTTTTSPASSSAPTCTVGGEGQLASEPHFTDRTFTRSFTMFQTLYADLARAHRRRRHRGFERRLEQQTQREYHRVVLHQLVR